MINLNKNITEITETTTVDMKTPANLSFNNNLSIPFSDRRIADRRIFNRRDIENSNIKKITIVIPALNEEQAIGSVIKEIPINELKKWDTK